MADWPKLADLARSVTMGLARDQGPESLEVESLASCTAAMERCPPVQVGRLLHDGLNRQLARFRSMT
jgi:hypothetical protein